MKCSLLTTATVAQILVDIIGHELEYGDDVFLTPQFLDDQLVPLIGTELAIEVVWKILERIPQQWVGALPRSHLREETGPTFG